MTKFSFTSQIKEKKMQVQNQLRPANILHSFQKLPYPKQPDNNPILVRHTQDFETHDT